MNNRGFTFIEIMVVVTIMAILAALVIPRIMGRTDEAKRKATMVQVRYVEGALQLYKLDNGRYPSTEQGLSALVIQPTTGVIPKRWKDGGYIAKLPKDAWGHSFHYVSPSAHGDFDIVSFGMDGEVGGEGDDTDLSLWNLEGKEKIH